jgi:hypothetical protein
MSRVQLDLTARETARLNHLMEVCDFRTKKDLFGSAFSALEWMVAERAAGRRVFSSKDGEVNRHFFALPALENVPLEVEETVSRKRDPASSSLPNGSGVGAAATASG